MSGAEMQHKRGLSSNNDIAVAKALKRKGNLRYSRLDSIDRIVIICSLSDSLTRPPPNLPKRDNVFNLPRLRPSCRTPS